MNKLTATDNKQKGIQKLALVLLLLIASGVIFVLPNLVSEPWINGSDQSQRTTIPSPTVVSPSTAAQKTQYRQNAQTVLAEIIQRRDRLFNERGVEQWGEFEYKQAQKAVERGDKEYSFGDYSDALSSYQRALEVLTELEEKAETLLEQAITEATAAIENSLLSTVVSASALATAIAPENPTVIQLNQRALSLPSVIEAMELGDQLLALNRLDQAKQAFTEAVTADPEHKKAAAALTSSQQQITEQRFRGYMSDGFRALDQNQFTAATEAFDNAGTVYPGHSAVAQALAQVETRRSQLWVSDRIARASELEAEEKWQQALEVYEELLATDNSLTDVKVKQIPVSVRADLDRRIKKALSDPLALSAINEYRRGQKVLQDASGIRNPGPVLQQQMRALGEVLKASQTPIQVVLTSDSNTDVTLFRVAKLGSFDKTAVSLKPGRYIVAGTRMGFRDVRVEFTVTDRGLDEPISVSCNEAIY
jgi:tetratricopeptide (TPR) repeat protein